MSVNAGSVRNLVINNSYRLNVLGSAEVDLDLGGLEIEAEAGSIGLHAIGTLKTGMIENIEISLDAARGDLEYLQGLINTGNKYPVEITLASGLTYVGVAFLTGQFRSANGKATLSLVADSFQRI